MQQTIQELLDVASKNGDQSVDVAGGSVPQISRSVASLDIGSIREFARATPGLRWLLPRAIRLRVAHTRGKLALHREALRG